MIEIKKLNRAFKYFSLLSAQDWEEWLRKSNFPEFAINQAIDDVCQNCKNLPSYAEFKNKILAILGEVKQKKDPKIKTFKLLELEDFIKTEYPKFYENAKKNLTLSFWVRSLKTKLCMNNYLDEKELIREFFQDVITEKQYEFTKVYGYTMEEIASNGGNWWVTQTLNKIYKGRQIVEGTFNSVLTKIATNTLAFQAQCLRYDLKRFHDKVLKD